MGSPAIVAVTGTGTAYWTPDTLQTPFVVSCALIMSGGAGTAKIDATWDDIAGTMDVGGVGTGNATWFNVVAFTAANQTALMTTPVQAYRVVLATALATTVVTVTFIQGMRPR